MTRLVPFACDGACREGLGLNFSIASGIDGAVFGQGRGHSNPCNHLQCKTAYHSLRGWFGLCSPALWSCHFSGADTITACFWRVRVGLGSLLRRTCAVVKPGGSARSIPKATLWGEQLSVSHA